MPVSMSSKVAFADGATQGLLAQGLPEEYAAGTIPG
jgi:hypothetical protein